MCYSEKQNNNSISERHFFILSDVNVGVNVFFIPSDEHIVTEICS